MNGGKIESRPVFDSAKQAPKAWKDKGGVMTLCVYYETTQQPLMGNLFQPGKSLKIESKVFVADPATLQPAEFMIRTRFPHFDEAMIATMFRDRRPVLDQVSEGGTLKVSRGWPVNGSHLVCPSEECVIYDRDFIWFVPGRGKSAKPMALVIPAPAESHTPASQLPAKAVLLPFGIVADVALNTWVVVAVASGANVDM